LGEKEILTKVRGTKSGKAIIYRDEPLTPAWERRVALMCAEGAWREAKLV
jgi:hypothetical protein